MIFCSLVTFTHSFSSSTIHMQGRGTKCPGLKWTKFSGSHLLVTCQWQVRGFSPSVLLASKYSYSHTQRDWVLSCQGWSIQHSHEDTAIIRILSLGKHLSRLKTARSSLKEELNRRCAEHMSPGLQNSVMANDSTFLIGQIWTNIRPSLTTFSYNRHVKKITFAWLGRTIDLQRVVQTLRTEEVSMLWNEERYSFNSGLHFQAVFRWLCDR